MQNLPETGFLRLKQIIGCRKDKILPIIPVSASTWWSGVQTGRFPKPVKLGPNTTAWRIWDIRALIDGAGGAK
jgi:predicted DNA-binding transcriptional regulator AlpA